MRAGALLLCLLLSACASAQADVAAVIDQPTNESRAELAQVVGNALNGAPATLADDALTKDSVLIIEKAHRLTGRELEKPERFRLVKSGAHCVLVYERTGKRATLASTSCSEYRKR
jgi:hypothetical protein